MAASDRAGSVTSLQWEHPGAPLSVFGHADPAGNDDYKKHLSGRRAEAIYALLTRDVARCETLSSTSTVGDGWGRKSTQIMPAKLGFDPGRPTGVINPQTKKAATGDDESTFNGKDNVFTGADLVKTVRAQAGCGQSAARDRTPRFAENRVRCATLGAVTSPRQATLLTRIRRRALAIHRTFREARMFASAMHSPDHPILAQVVPIRRCNLSCTYCNEFDKTSDPVPADEMLRRLDHLARLGTTIVTFSGGEPMLHPHLDLLIRRVRSNGAICTLITNGYFLTPARIGQLNRAGLDYLQISIDNVQPDEVSNKSLKVLDLKLQWLAAHAEFPVTINSVLGSAIRNPGDALAIAVRARQLGFHSTVGLLHDHHGQLRGLSPEQQSVYQQIRDLGSRLFSFNHFEQFQRNIASGLPNDWHCTAGGRFLYICEDGLVHYCSQQRGSPAIPLAEYTAAHLRRERKRPKPCAPFCTISCVHQTAFLDRFREKPQQTLVQILEANRRRDPGFRPPPLVRALSWMFLHPGRREAFGKVALRVFGLTKRA